MLDLYQRRFEGRRLRPDKYVICADEKSQLQALGRMHASSPPAPGRPGRFEFEYQRNGTLAYLAGWDVHHANLLDRVEAKAGIEAFGRLVDDVMTVEPYASARRVFWIVDNGSSHGQASIDRLEGAYGNLRLIHLPIHASWLNQIELYFSIVQRKALTPNDFDSLEALGERLLRFGDHYRAIARPFRWSSPRRPRPPPRQDRNASHRARRMTTELAGGCTSLPQVGGIESRWLSAAHPSFLRRSEARSSRRSSERRHR